MESLPNATALPYNIISIRVADTVKEIPLTLFSSCTTLKELIIPSCIKTIPERGFTKHPNITTVTISESVTSIEDLAFEDCSNLTSINIPSNVTNIGYSAFSGCSSLARVTIGNGVTSIGSHAFDNCSSLASINIPNSVTSIGDQTFRGCSSLANITVDAVNPNYKSIDGNLYSKDGKTLIRYAIGKTATVDCSMQGGHKPSVCRNTQDFKMKEAQQNERRLYFNIRNVRTDCHTVQCSAHSLYFRFARFHRQLSWKLPKDRS